MTISPVVAGGTGGVTLTIRAGERWVKITGGDIQIYAGEDASSSNLALRITENTPGYEIMTYGMNNGTINQNIYTRIAPGFI